MKLPLREFSKNLRRHSTDAERQLWLSLRSKRLGGFKFRRQHPIGPFIVDFCCIESKLIIELDGGQHIEREKADAIRTEFLNQQGFRVLRFWDNQALKELESVLTVILSALSDPHPDPLPKRERGNKKGIPSPLAGEG